MLDASPAAIVAYAFRRALASVRAVPTWGALAWGGGIAFVTLAVLVAVGWHSLLSATLLSPDKPWLEALADIAGGLLLTALAWFLFAPVMLVVTSFFLEGVAEKVERHDYPNTPPARPVGWRDGMTSALRLFGLTVVLNLLALPFYFVPIVNIAVYAGINGLLLGREYFELVALRHASPAEVRALRRTHMRSILGAGMLIALGYMLPVVNLFAGIFGVHLMVHLTRTLTDAPAG